MSNGASAKVKPAVISVGSIGSLLGRVDVFLSKAAKDAKVSKEFLFAQICGFYESHKKDN